jgi:DNA-binding MarR family transcriptional regulator
MLYLRDIPKYEAIRARARRYPDIDPAAVEAFLIWQRVATDALVAVETYLGRHGMSQGRFTVMAVLNRDPQIALTCGDLSEKCGVTRATMTGLLDGLERDKLAKRDQHGGDRRKTTVSLTAEGISFLDSLMPEYYKRLAKLMGNLTAAEKKTLEEMMAKINAGIPAMLVNTI